MKLATLLLALILTGCAANPETGRTELTEGGKVALIQVATIGVDRYFRENPRHEEKAGRIRAVLTELQNSDEVTTVAGLKFLLQQRIDKLDDPYDRQDLTNLLNTLTPLLAQYVGSGELDSTARFKLKEFIGYVVTALPRPV